jgi:hypothetical protein
MGKMHYSHTSVSILIPQLLNVLCLLKMLIVPTNHLLGSSFIYIA